ncbi:MAG: plastocyanin/azurin family copper-binding protein [Nitrosopumilus sp.]
MNFSYGVIAAVGVLAAISLILISISPSDVIEPREMSQKPIICSMDYAPVCGVDGETYSNFCVLEASDVRLDYGGACVDPSSEVEMEGTSTSLTVVSLAEGSGIPGCETTNECYLPYEITVSPGTTVTWNNDDSAAHTVTSGSIDAGLTGIFDSSIFMTGTSFEFTFDDVGTYDYFCMVHPWMTGIVNVV